MIIMNEEQLVHYDPLKIENIFLSTLVHWFFWPNYGLFGKVPCLRSLEVGHNEQILGVVRWTITRVKLRMQVLCYEVHNQLL